MDSEDEEALQAAHDVVVQAFQLLQLDINTGKCAWTANVPESECNTLRLQTNDGQVKYSSTIKTMGVMLCPQDSGEAEMAYLDTKLGAFSQRMVRLRYVPVGWEGRAQMAGALAAAATYGAGAGDPSDDMVRRATRSVVEAMAGGKQNTRRCAEVATALLAPVHRTNLKAAFASQRFLLLWQLLGLSQTAAEVVRQAWQAQQSMQVQGGFIYRICRDMTTIGWTWIEWNQFRSDTGEIFLLSTQDWAGKLRAWSLDVHEMDVEEVCKLKKLSIAHVIDRKKASESSLHALRSSWRRVLATDAGNRRRDMEGLKEDCKDLVAEALAKVEGSQKPRARAILMGATITKDRWHRSTSSKDSSSTNLCSFCSGNLDTEEHRYWKCPAWIAQRRHYLGPDLRWVQGHFKDLPSAARNCLLPVFPNTAGGKRWGKLWPQILQMGCDILEAVSERQG